MKRRVFVIVSGVIVALLFFGNYKLVVARQARSVKEDAIETKPKAPEEKQIKDPKDAVQDQLNEAKRQLAIERYNSRLKDFKATKEMVQLEDLVSQASQAENETRIKILKDLEIKPEDYNKWKFDSEHGKLIQYTEDELRALAAQQAAGRVQ